MDRPLILEIAEKKRQTPLVTTLHFRDRAKASPGQYYMIWVPGVDEIPMSLCDIGELKGIAVQVWPQDNDWPYPPAGDAEVTMLGLEATNHLAEPASLPSRPAAIWMTHFRANLPHDVSHALGELAGGIGHVCRWIPCDTVQMMSIEHAQRCHVHPFLDP